MNIYIVSKITVTKGQQDKFKPHLLKLVEQTHKEDGCIQYDMHQDIDKPNIFFAYESWTDADKIDKHNHSAHIKAFENEVLDIIENVELSTMHKL